MSETSLYTKVKYWLWNGGAAILDQGVFSGANFVLTILLARWLIPEQYGAYVIGFSVLVLFLQILLSFILEPMAVLGPSGYGDNLGNYFAAQLRLYFAFTGLMGCSFSVIIAVYGLSTQKTLITLVMTAIGLALPLILLPWMLRRIFYVLGSPAVSLCGSAIYSISLVGFVYAAKQLDILTGVSSVLVVAFAGFVSGFFLLAQLKQRYDITATLGVKDLFRENWVFGKWLVLSGILMGLASQLQVFITGTILGLEAAGVLYALQTLTQPMALSVSAVTALFTSSLATDYARDDIRSFKSKAALMTFTLVGITVIMELLLFFFRIRLEIIVYGGKYSAYADLIPIWGLCPIIAALFSGMQYSLQAAKRPDSLLIASLFWVPASLVFGVAFAKSWGLWGVAWSAVVGYTVLGVALALLYWFWLIRIPGFHKA